ncbi:MAG TPA: hypothetical protein VLL52_11815 [Anaerolineae bacterium]|nr:hypothetical protein [Anaerolineae bacterium]
MDTLLATFGLTMNELITMITLLVIGVIILTVLRFAIRLTATLMRIGCFLIILVVGAVLFLSMIN